jgi:iron-sulfur cluster assembly protein
MRPRPQVMSITQAAADRVRETVSNATSPVIGVRIGIKNGGCAGMAYTVEYADSVRPHDEVIEDKGVTILVDPKAVLFLLGTQMDVKTDKFSSVFVFNNPNETSACGCGESVAIKPVVLPEGLSASH